MEWFGGAFGRLSGFGNEAASVRISVQAVRCSVWRPVSLSNLQRESSALPSLRTMVYLS